MHLRRSLLSLSFLAVAACNSSSTVGSNDAEDGTGGAGGDGSVAAGTSSGGSPSTGTPAATSGVTSSSGGEGGEGGNGGASSSTNSGSQVASVTTGATTSSSGGGIENAYVLVRAMAYDAWLQSGTSVTIEANLEPFDPVVPAPSACASSTQSPTMYVAPDNIDLGSAAVTASAPGFGTVDAFWTASSNSLSATFPDVMPDGTVIDVAFGAGSPIFPGESLSVTVRSVPIDVPLVQIAEFTSIDYQEGTDLVFDWPSAPLASSLGAFVVMTTPPNPPPDMVVVWCAAAAPSSGHVLGVSLMDELLADNQAKIDAGWGGQIWTSLALIEEQGHEVETSGNFVTTVSQVNFSRPVAVSP